VCTLRVRAAPVGEPWCGCFQLKTHTHTRIHKHRHMYAHKYTSVSSFEVGGGFRERRDLMTYRNTKCKRTRQTLILITDRGVGALECMCVLGPALVARNA